MTPTLEDLAARVSALLGTESERVILGITGTPGSGKTTLAQWIIDRFDDGTGNVAWIPMDGFHLADSELDRLGSLQRKGAIDTFDGFGYVATLRRIRNERANVVYAPEFDRTIEQPIAGGMAVRPSARLIVTEGNYLLDDSAPWDRVRQEVEEVWFCEVSPEVRRERLLARHIRFGKSPDDAADWIDRVDEVNAQRIAATSPRADLVVAVPLANQFTRPKRSRNVRL